MNLINVGGRFINLDTVTEIQEGQDYDGNWRVEVWFNSMNSEVQASATFKGDAAHKLLAWLSHNSIDINAPEHHDDEYREYQANGGEMGYISWQNVKRNLASCMQQPDSWFDNPANRKIVADLEARLLY